MSLKFRDDVTETEILRFVGDKVSEGNPLLGYGCYSTIFIKEITDYLLGIIFCPLSIPILTWLGIFMFQELIKEFFESAVSDIRDISMVIIGLLYALLFSLAPVIMIFTTVKCIKGLKKARHTVHYAYTFHAMFTIVDEDMVYTTLLPNVKCISVKRHGRYGKVSVRYPQYLTLTTVMYVEDPEKFCENYSINPVIKIYLNHKKYSGFK